MGTSIHQLQGVIVDLDPTIRAKLRAHRTFLALWQKLCFFERRYKLLTGENGDRGGLGEERDEIMIQL